MKHGFTLLEVMIASAIFVIVCGMAMTFSVSAVTQTDITTREAAAQVGLVRISEIIERDLAQSAVDYNGLTSAAPSVVAGPPFVEGPPFTVPVADQIQPLAALTGTGSNMITFRTVQTTEGVDTVWTSWITHQLTPASGEIPLNAIDDNGNGIIDEMWFQRLTPPGLPQIIGSDINFVSTPDNPDPIRYVLTGTLLDVFIQYSTSDEEGSRFYHFAVALSGQ